MNYLARRKRSYGWPVLAGLLFCAVLALIPGIARALPQDITMTPTSTDAVINPGDTYHGSFQILNQGQTSYTFHVYATPYHVSGEAYTPEFTILPTAPNVTSWFNFSQAEGRISPGQSVTIDYTIILPKTTPPGGYYAAAFAETQYPKSTKTSSITLNARVGEIFYIQAAGPVAKKGELLTWQSNMFQQPPLTSTVRLQNDGGVHYKADIRYNIRDIFGHLKYRLHTSKEVLPQTIRRVSIPWNKTPTIGLFKVDGTVDFLGQHKVLPAKWVLVMSSTAIIISIAVIVLIIALPTLYRRRKTKKSRKK
jgi:hypothetical protein